MMNRLTAVILQKQLHSLQVFLALVLLGIFSGCAISPPVQEMSNARQTLQAARDANATKFAPDYLQEAETLIKAATEALDSGDYLNARELAITAQQQAIKARQKSLSRQKSENQ